MSQLLDVRYQIVRVLSSDQIGESYVVADIHEKNSPYYVLKKIFLLSQDEQDLSRIENLFANEARSLQQIAQKHDRIQKIFSYWEENKEFYLLKEFINGSSLSQEIEKLQHLTEEVVINILSSILKILVHVHGQGLIHRNITLSNIIKRDIDGEFILVDFGNIEAVNNNIGEYAPMEQFHGNPVFNSDIYALGIVAISALTGLSAQEITGVNSPKNLITGEIRWRHRSPKVSGTLANIINKMVKLDYRHRYQSALDALIDIRRLQDKHFSIQQARKVRIYLILLAGATSFLVAALISWITVKPNDMEQAQLYFEQGINKYEAGNYKAAIQHFSQAIDINPDYAQAYNQRGDSYYRLGEYEKSQTDSSTAIRLNPKDSNSFYDRGYSLYSSGDFNGAIADYNQAIKIDSKNANVYYARGLARNQIKERQGALEDFNKAILLNPIFATAYIERGKALRRRGERLDALKDFDQAVTLQPENLELYYERGLTYYQLNQQQAAKKDFTKVIELDPKYIKAYLARGDVYSNLSDPEKAYADYNQALLIDKKYADTYIHWGNYRLVKNNDVVGAISEFNKAIALEPNNASAYNYRGNANLERGSLQFAIKDYTKAIEINSEYALAYYNRGLVYTDLGRVPEAISDFDKAAQFFLDKNEQNSYNDAKARLKELSPKS